MIVLQILIVAIITFLILTIVKGESKIGYIKGKLDEAKIIRDSIKEAMDHIDKSSASKKEKEYGMEMIGFFLSKYIDKATNN